MEGDVLRRGLVEVSELRLGEPDGLAIEPDLKVVDSILMDDELDIGGAGRFRWSGGHNCILRLIWVGGYFVGLRGSLKTDATRVLSR